MITAPFGTWDSPISPELMTRAGVRISAPDISEQGDWTWVEGRPLERGRNVVVRRSADGQTADVSPEDRSVRTRVHEYGGRAYLGVGAALYFVDFMSQRLCRSEGGVVAELTDGTVRLADFVHDRAHARLFAVAERAVDGGQPENALAAVDLASSRVDLVVRGHDFFAAPALSPDGRRLAFLAWDHPHMPWDAATLYVADIAADGSVGAPRALAGGPSGSAFQPSFDAEGSLYACVEVEDRWTLFRFEGERAVPLGKSAEWEVGTPLWNLGTRVYGFTSTGTAIAIAYGGGFAKLIEIDLKTGSASVVCDEYAMIGELACRGKDVLFTIGWAGSATRLVHYDVASKTTQTLRYAFEGAIEDADVSSAEPVSFETTGGDTAHGFFYAPRNSRYQPPAGSKPPLMVLAHGGPTGCANPTLQLSVQFWTTRGFAVLDVNYRGSTTFGRAYREKLRGRWGEVDAEDCAAGARFLAESGRVDPDRVIIRGQSAGGYTVLRVLTEQNVFRAAACLYGPADPRALVHDSHKFESHYDRYLFGSGDGYERALDERAPIHAADRIQAPVIFFQGMEDKAVPPQQTQRMYEALTARGIATEYHGYEGEQHGFRKAETIRDVWTKELAFYRRVLAL